MKAVPEHRPDRAEYEDHAGDRDQPQNAGKRLVEGFGYEVAEQGKSLVAALVPQVKISSPSGVDLINLRVDLVRAVRYVDAVEPIRFPNDLSKVLCRDEVWII